MKNGYCIGTKEVKTNSFNFMRTLKGDDYKTFEDSETAHLFLIENGVPIECIKNGEYVVHPYCEVVRRSL